MIRTAQDIADRIEARAGTAQPAEIEQYELMLEALNAISIRETRMEGFDATAPNQYIRDTLQSRAITDARYCAEQERWGTKERLDAVWPRLLASMWMLGYDTDFMDDGHHDGDCARANVMMGFAPEDFGAVVKGA